MRHRKRRPTYDRPRLSLPRPRERAADHPVAAYLEVYAYLNAEPLPADERRRLKILADNITEAYRDGWNGYIPDAEMGPEDLDL
jgi:hypothetical protein